MKEIVEWLISMEDRASRVYEAAASAFRDDELFSAFVERLSNDEAMHFHFMNSALICLNKNPQLISDIQLDQGATEIIEQSLERIESAILIGALNQSAMIESIIACEHSEWNDIFLYVANSLKRNCPHFKVIGPSMQNHLRIIENYLKEAPNGSDFLPGLKKLAPVWQEKVLVVDDSEPIRDLLRSILSKEGIVKFACNGEEAYKMVSQDYYAVIISDIDMPLMNGIEFYKKLKNRYKDVCKRFIFMSGETTSQILEYIKSENIVFLKKPFRLKEIQKAVGNVIEEITL